MVGGLVQYDQAWLEQKQLAQGNPCLLAAGEGGDAASEFFFQEAESFEDAGQLASVRVAAACLEIVG